MVASGIKIFSLLSSIVGGGSGSNSGPIVAQEPDRIDTVAAAQDDDLDEAMGTMMALGGKYLRKVALWAWEHATSTPSEKLGK